MIKKTALFLLCLVLSSCGYQSLVKESGQEIFFKEISYSGDNNLNFIIKSKINLRERLSSNYEISITTSSNIAALSKKSSGEVESKDIYLNSTIEIFKAKKSIYTKGFTAKKVVKIGDSLSDNLDTIESAKNNLVSEIANKIKLDIQFFSIRNK
tara:strand:+ start:5124 stop:5585 length:462 start_codon:yes stop_codon:yes gene_type:complete